MLRLRLPFFIAFAVGQYLLREALAERDPGLARQGFRWLIALCILHAVLIGLVWGYGLNRLCQVLPVMARLGFTALVNPQPGPSLTAVALQILPTPVILPALAVLTEASTS